MTDDPKTSRCRAGTETQRCSFRGTREELADHADEMGHARCIVCGDTLAWHETQTCDRDTNRVRDDLDAVATAFAHLERVILQTAHRMGGGIPGGNALVYLADGSTQGGGPDDWLTDPTPVLAVLEANERDWRHEFGHGPAVDVATVAGCLGYLRTWHLLAARTHPGFDDYATEVRELRSRLEHVVGLADDPVRAPAECFDCGGQLVRSFAPLTATTEVPEHDCARCSSRHSGRHGDNREGLTDDWTCRGCGRVYDQPSYFLALRSRRDECQGWVPVRLAAEVLRRPVQTVWWWQQQMAVASVCDPDSRQILVDWTEVAARAAQTRTDRRAS